MPLVIQKLPHSDLIQLGNSIYCLKHQPAVSAEHATGRTYIGCAGTSHFKNALEFDVDRAPQARVNKGLGSYCLGAFPLETTGCTTKLGMHNMITRLVAQWYTLHAIKAVYYMSHKEPTSKHLRQRCSEPCRTVGSRKRGQPPAGLDRSTEENMLIQRSPQVMEPQLMRLLRPEMCQGAGP